MSNRIRILLNHAGQVHMGLKALAYLQQLVQQVPATPTEEWVPEREWQRRGRPAFISRNLIFDEWSGKPSHNYRLQARPVNTPSYISMPSLGCVVEKAKWLWAHLPPNVKSESQLFVTRENKRHSWRHSPCNPRNHGWSFRIAPKRKAAITPETSTKTVSDLLNNTPPVSGISLAAAEGMLTSLWADTVNVVQAPTTASLPYKKAKDSYNKFSTKVNFEQESSQQEIEGNLEMPAIKLQGYTVHAASYGQQAPKVQKVHKASTPKASPATTTAPTPRTKRLQVGIWG